MWLPLACALSFSIKKGYHIEVGVDFFLEWGLIEKELAKNLYLIDRLRGSGA